MREIANRIVNIFESAIEAEREKLRVCCSSDISQEDARKYYLEEVLKSLRKNGVDKKSLIRIFDWAVYLEAVQRCRALEEEPEYSRIHKEKDALISSYSKILDDISN